MKRVLVIGCSGAGKSTFAARLGQLTGLPYVATDPFYWEAHWRPAPRETIERRLTEVISTSSWILDGNFVEQRDPVWNRADTVFWLDLALPRVLIRIVRRNLRWWLTGDSIWSGNRMTLRRAWSGVTHAFLSHSEKRSGYPGYLAEFPHLNVIRFRTKGDVDAWLASSQRSSPPVSS